MFDLDKAIFSYLEKLKDKRFFSRDFLDEIESHLRDKMDFYIEQGLSVEKAFEKIGIEMGSPEDLQEEFEKLFESDKRGQVTNILSHYFDRRVVMRLLVGFVLGVFFFLLGLYLEGGHVRSLIQPTAFIIVVGGAFGALLITYPVRIVMDSLVLAISGRQAFRAKYLDAANVFKSFGDLAVLSSFIGIIFGTIHVLSHLGAIQLIGAGCAVAIVSILYGVLVKLFIGRALSDSFLERAYPSVETIKSGNDRGKLKTAKRQMTWLL